MLNFAGKYKKHFLVFITIPRLFSPSKSFLTLPRTNLMIDQNTINKILDTARIEEVVGDFVSLRKSGANYMGLCPFHDERTPSFSVSPSKGIFKCFSCGKGGNVVHFVKEHEQLSYSEALKWLARKYNIEVVEKELSEEEKQLNNDRESMFIVNEFARDYFVKNLHESVEGQSVGLAYFQGQRRLREDIVRKFQLGYCSEQRDTFTLNALQHGYQKDMLIKTGLSIQTQNNALFDRYRGRVIFPVHTISGKVVAFGGRILKKDEKLAKYVNSPESEIYSKSAELYGLYFAKKSIIKENCCYLVEGYLDVISMHQAGIENVVASSGTSLTHGQIRQIHRFSENITVLYDGDAAGIKAALRGINLLLEDGMNVKVVLLPEGEDPDSYAQSHSAVEVMDYIRQNECDFISFKTNILLKDCENDPVGRARMIQDIVESIALIPNEIIRSEYIRACSRQLQTREELLLKEVGKKRRDYIERIKQKKNYERNQQGLGTQQPVHQQPETETQPSTDLLEALIQSGKGPTEKPVQKERQSLVGHDQLEAYEKNLLKMVLRYGERILYEDEGLNVSVLAFIKTELENDNVDFQHPLYREMLHEAYAHLDEADFIPERHFLRHPKSEFSMITAELITDRYELSKIYNPSQEDREKATDTSAVNFTLKVEKEEDTLLDLVPRLIMELKHRILRRKINQAAEEIKLAERSGNAEALTKALTSYRDLREIEKSFAKTLGERIICR